MYLQSKCGDTKGNAPALAPHQPMRRSGASGHGATSEVNEFAVYRSLRLNRGDVQVHYCSTTVHWLVDITGPHPANSFLLRSHATAAFGYLVVTRLSSTQLPNNTSRGPPW